MPLPVFLLGLLQRIDLDKRLLPLRPFPVAEQFILVLRCPFDHETKCPWREVACEDSKGYYINQHLILSIKRMEMRRIVVIEKHLDDDPIKSGNFRHTPPFVLYLEIDLLVSDWLF
jgi:hypothetical protein